MNGPTPQDENARPKLAAKAELRTDPITRRPLLLYPEGLLQLNATAHAILALCDGTRTVKDLVESLTAEFESTAERLRADVTAILGELQRRQLLLLLS